MNIEKKDDNDGFSVIIEHIHFWLLTLLVSSNNKNSPSVKVSLYDQRTGLFHLIENQKQSMRSRKINVYYVQKGKCFVTYGCNSHKKSELYCVRSLVLLANVEPLTKHRIPEKIRGIQRWSSFETSTYEKQQRAQNDHYCQNDIAKDNYRYCHSSLSNRDGSLLRTIVDVFELKMGGWISECNEGDRRVCSLELLFEWIDWPNHMIATVIHSRCCHSSIPFAKIMDIALRS